MSCGFVACGGWWWAWQGDEREIVIVAFVRSNSELGFLTDFRRLNVALTRARRGLVLVGNLTALSRDRSERGDLQALVRDARDREVVRRLRDVVVDPAVVEGARRVAGLGPVDAEARHAVLNNLWTLVQEAGRAGLNGAEVQPRYANGSFLALVKLQPHPLLMEADL